MAEAAAAWKGYLSFGLISVPIRLYPAARPSRIHFHEIHRTCGTRVRQPLYCPHHQRQVSRDEIVMGYQVDKDKYVLVEPQELKKLEPRSSKAMEILQLVNLSEVDPLYYETSYFSVPQEAGRRAYTLLRQTMERLKLAAVAKLTIHHRERAVILRSYEHGLTLHTIYYPKEIHQRKEYGHEIAKNLREEVELAEQFAKALVKPFRPQRFHDEYQARVRRLIENKRKGRTAPKPEKEKQLAPVIDLMSALKKSIAQSGKAAGISGAKRLRKTA